MVLAPGTTRPTVQRPPVPRRPLSPVAPRQGPRAPSHRPVARRAPASEALEHRRVGHAAALAHRLQPVPRPPCAACGAPAWSSAGHRTRRAGGRARSRRRRGLSRAGSAPVSASQASGTDANASLTSNVPMSARSSPARFRTACVAGIGAGQHEHRVDADHRHGVDPGHRAPARARRDLAGGDEQRAGAVGDLRGVARGDGAALLERRLQPGQHRRGRARADALVLGHVAAHGRAPGATAPSKRAGRSCAAAAARARPRAVRSRRAPVAGQAPAAGDHLGADALVERRPAVARRSWRGPNGAPDRCGRSRPSPPGSSTRRRRRPRRRTGH